MTPSSPSSEAPALSPALDARLRDLGSALGAAFRELVEPLTGTRPRAADIVTALGIDKTQAWRISRVIECEDPYEALYESSAPKGLAQVVAAASKAGATGESCRAASIVVDRFASLVSEFPDGRAGVDAALSSRVPRAKDAADRDARRKVMQGMAQVFGVRASSRYIASALVPAGDDGVAVDVAAVAGYIGFRRVREGPQPIVFSGRHYAPVAGAEPPSLLTLDGDADPDPRRRFLSEFSSLSPDALSLHQEGNELRLVLSGDSPGVNAPVDMYFGQRIARTLKRYRVGEARHEIVNHLLKIPCDAAVFDTFIRDDVHPDADPPRSTVERFGFNPGVQSGRPDDEAFRVDQALDTQPLGTGLRRAASRDVPGLPQMLASVFEKLGEDPNRYRLYRTHQIYPLPGFSVVTWLDLPDAP